MDYSTILTRAWHIIWNNKFLIVLGILVALGSGGGGGSGGSGGGSGGSGSGGFMSTPVPGQDWSEGMTDYSPLANIPDEMWALGIGFLVVIAGILLIIGIAVWVISRIAAGGLIAGVNQIETENVSGFKQAWSAGWQKGWRLLGIGIIPMIPMLIGLFVFLVLLLTVGGFSTIFDDPSAFNSDAVAYEMSTQLGLWISMSVILCLVALISVVLSIFAGLADRACMLEDKGVFESYGRGWEILSNNFGSAVILVLIHIGLALGIGLILCLPTVFMSLCCLLWPVLWAISGTTTAYFSTVWTLAWREWVGGAPGEFVIEKAPLV
ncbi:MAG: hypothetical protein JXB07_14015 [Anaerolineae bacterium]|nr:hypothetical protein [Anaerolineae bacterium]